MHLLKERNSYPGRLFRPHQHFGTFERRIFQQLSSNRGNFANDDIEVGFNAAFKCVHLTSRTIPRHLYVPPWEGMLAQ